MSGLRLPQGLKYLKITHGSAFNEYSARIDWPPGLVEMDIDHMPVPCCFPTARGPMPPQGLKVLTMGGYCAESLLHMGLPETLECVVVPWVYPVCRLQGREWPRSMRTITVGPWTISFRQGVMVQLPPEINPEGYPVDVSD